MKAVMLSIQPIWCEHISAISYSKISTGLTYLKTIEIRKSKPNIDVPFKVYIYATNKNILVQSPKHLKNHIELMSRSIRATYKNILDLKNSGYTIYNGKVIGEFICDEIYEYKHDDYQYGTYDISDDELQETFLTNRYLWDYGKGKTLYGWHISELKIYDKPKELSKFVSFCKEYENERRNICRDCKYYYCESNESIGFFEQCCCDGIKPLTRPPQSWCYVEGNN